MGAYISLSSEIGGRALIGAWALKGTNTVNIICNIRIYHEFVDRTDNSVTRVFVWHHNALRLSFPQTHVGFFFLHTLGVGA